MRAAWLLALLVPVATSGCMSGDGMATKLRDASTDYNKSLRWRDIDRAAEFLPREAQMEFLARQEEYAEDLIVLDYEVTRLDLDKQTGVASSRATIWWHTDDSTVVETTTIDQLWQFHHGNFVLVDERRASGQMLGLFAEADEPHPYLPGLQPYRKMHDIGADKKKHGRKKPPPEPQIHWPHGPIDSRSLGAARAETGPEDSAEHKPPHAQNGPEAG